MTGLEELLIKYPNLDYDFGFYKNANDDDLLLSEEDSKQLIQEYYSGRELQTKRGFTEATPQEYLEWHYPASFFGVIDYRAAFEDFRLNWL